MHMHEVDSGEGNKDWRTVHDGDSPTKDQSPPAVALQHGYSPQCSMWYTTTVLSCALALPQSPPAQEHLRDVNVLDVFHSGGGSLPFCCRTGLAACWWIWAMIVSTPPLGDFILRGRSAAHVDRGALAHVKMAWQASRFDGLIASAVSGRSSNSTVFTSLKTIQPRIWQPHFVLACGG